MGMIFKPSYDGPECDINCYCDACAEAATQWYQWCFPDGTFIGGDRFWRLEHALMVRVAAEMQGATDLWFYDINEDVSVKLVL